MTPEIVLGPPGTGKTTTLLGYVEEELASGVPPDRIGYVAFTRRAATEAASRAAEKFNMDRHDLRYFRTIHSMCFNVLGISSGDVLEGKKLLEFGDWAEIELSENSGRWTDEGASFGSLPGDRALFMDNLARVRCIPLREQWLQDSDGLTWDFVKRFSELLQLYKKDHHLLDYTDMLEEFVRGDWSPVLSVLLVDEAQDLSLMQWRVIEKLAEGARRVVVAGDDDQAIYHWAGAAVPHFVGMAGEEMVLGQSYRCPVSVQELAAGVLSTVSERRQKVWSPRPDQGVLERWGNLRLRESVPDDLRGDDILVLVRNAQMAREDVMPVLRRLGIVYEWRGHPSVRRGTLESVVLWERLRRGERISGEAARRVYSMLRSGPGVRRGYKRLPQVDDEQMIDMNYLVEHGGLQTREIWHRALSERESGTMPNQERVYLLNSLKNGEKLAARPRVRVSTVHGSKGGEADHVILLTDMARRTYREMLRSPEDEARVWYVAVTRARERLTLVSPRRAERYDL